MIRRLLLAMGIGSFVVGIVAALTGADVPGVDRAWLLLVAGLALIQGAWVVDRAHRKPVRRIATGDTELPASAPAPGDDDWQLYGHFLGRIQSRGQNRAIAGLRAATVEVVRRVEAVDVEEAERLVQSGDWTTNEQAATFLRAGPTGWTPLDLVDRLVGHESNYGRDFQGVVGELLGLLGATPGTASADVDDGPTTVRTAAEGAVDTVDAEETNHWAGVGMVVLLSVVVGVYVEEPAVLLVGAVGMGYAAYARSGTVSPPDLAVDRRLSDADPSPGDEVTVEVTVTNDGDGVLPDLRIVDVVPDELAVVGGSARHASALRPGESASFEYVVEARRGRHEFAPTLVVSRPVTGRVERADTYAAEASFSCVPDIRAPALRVPLRARATRYAGQLGIDAGGEGIEFYGVREYRPGDPLSRIDWNRRARTKELTTLEFRKERAARVQLVIDARRSARVAPTPTARHAIDRSVEAAGYVLADLLERGDQVGIGALGPETCWLEPGAGSEHRARARELLAVHPAFTGVPADVDDEIPAWERELRRRLSDGTQVVLFTPLVDTGSGFLARRLDALGYPVTVVSPDATTDRTAINQLATVDRAIRVRDVRDAGIPVLDWGPDELFDLAIARARERRSR